MLNSSQRKPTENWQKSSYTTKAARKISIQPGRTKKKNKASGRGQHPWGVLMKEERFSHPENCLCSWEVHQHRQGAEGAWSLLARSLCVLVC